LPCTASLPAFTQASALAAKLLDSDQQRARKRKVAAKQRAYRNAKDMETMISDALERSRAAGVAREEEEKGAAAAAAAGVVLLEPQPDEEAGSASSELRRGGCLAGAGLVVLVEVARVAGCSEADLQALQDQLLS
jgi:isoaspartyl peptidase/L-asparaginase-like protein (Ntn-hydrolase superfamily)